MKFVKVVSEAGPIWINPSRIDWFSARHSGLTVKFAGKAEPIFYEGNQGSAIDDLISPLIVVGDAALKEA